jgi:hypothetical protein
LPPWPVLVIQITPFTVYGDVIAASYILEMLNMNEGGL